MMMKKFLSFLTGRETGFFEKTRFLLFKKFLHNDLKGNVY